ncbi:uracil-DNA glycosylase [Sulfurospirillum sp. T05]|uniref:Type-4 uracil-DNA glycosylase n=1 Tax=Sulfurospirillum tamanense TaxID=2813362 RepID=A0ABS2WTQ7_9BACT|nr:uracil-DNA glycosylase [Sulfurospirillum tamanensis]MBN2964569.1 uracil-DNA glycosylase [Sulfurospirillum tamanensis]
MTHIEKIHFLHQLYQYRALGFNYIKHERNLTPPSVVVSDGSLQTLEKSLLACQLCALAKCRKKVVFGEGNPSASIMFIGEGPGASEDESGRPFVGRAGQLLTKIIENVLHVKRSEVYIANIVKCRPPKNRVPFPEEVDACKPFLLQQIAQINPRIIVALGSTSYHHLTGEFDSKITQVRGQVIAFGDAKLVPTYHPSFLLRNPSAKKEVYLDMLKVKSLL